MRTTANGRFLFLALVPALACGGAPREPVTPDTPPASTAEAPPAPTDTVTTTATAPSATPTPEPPPAPSTPPPQVNPPRGDGGLRATTAMPIDSSIDKDRLLSDIGKQVTSLTKCVALIRKTDNVVGSLNVEANVGKDKKIKLTLRSPVNPEAEKCIADGTKKWTAETATGTGRAMVLLVLDDKPAM